MDTKIIILLIALAFSAFFSSCETVFIVFDKVKLFLWRRKKSVFTRTLDVFFPHQERFVITSLVGVNAANVAFSSVAAVFLVGAGLPAWLVVIISTVIILTFAEIIPKAVSLRTADVFARPYSLVLWLFYIAAYPIVAVLSRMFSSFMRKSDISHKRLLSRDALKRMLAADKTELHPERVELASTALSLASQKMREVMTPRTDLKAAPLESSLEDIRRIMNETGHSKIVIYRDNIDNPLGYIHVLDLLREDKVTVMEMVRPAEFVSEFTSVIRGIKLLRRKKVGMLLVLDEYGGLDGIATIEDLAEELVGEIEDEYDQPRFRYRKLEEGKFLIAGRAEIDDLNRDLGLEIEKPEGVETFGGWLITRLGRIPQEREKVEVGDFRIQVLLADEMRVKTLLAERI